MSKEALRDAFMAGRRSMGDYGNAGDAAFDLWMERALDGADRSSAPTTPLTVREVTLSVESFMCNPPKPANIGVLDEDSRLIGVTTLDELKRCAADLERLEGVRR